MAALDVVHVFKVIHVSKVAWEVTAPKYYAVVELTSFLIRISSTF